MFTEGERDSVSSLVSLLIRTLRGVCVLSHFSGVRLFVTPWTIACQAPLPMGFFRQEYWSGLPFPSPTDLPDPGIKCGCSALQVDTLLYEPPGKPSSYH